MKSNSLPTILLGVLAISALASLVFCWIIITNLRDARVLQPQVAMVQQNRAVAANLAAEVLDYSKTHPDINPILEAVKLREKPGQTNPAVKPAGK
jgi:hypothetical protein